MTRLSFLLLLLLIPVHAQKLLTPINVSLTDAGADRHNQAMRQAVLAELQSLGYVAITSKNVKWRISVSAVPLKGCDGISASLLVVDAGDKRKLGELSSHAGPDARAVAREMVEKLKIDDLLYSDTAHGPRQETIAP